MKTKNNSKKYEETIPSRLFTHLVEDQCLVSCSQRSLSIIAAKMSTYRNNVALQNPKHSLTGKYASLIFISNEEDADDFVEILMHELNRSSLRKILFELSISKNEKHNFGSLCNYLLQVLSIKTCIECDFLIPETCEHNPKIRLDIEFCPNDKINQRYFQNRSVSYCLDFVNEGNGVF
jgi:hypothetical protein